MSKSRDPAPVEIHGGLSCPKCGRTMRRYIHSMGWRPLPEKGHYKWWDRCKPCGHYQMYPDAYVAAVGSAKQSHREPQKRHPNRKPWPNGPAELLPNGAFLTRPANPIPEDDGTIPFDPPYVKVA